MKESKSHNILLALYICISITSITLTFICISLYNKVNDLEDTIEIKNNRIQELLIQNENCNMAKDEVYELFLDCVNKGN